MSEIFKGMDEVIETFNKACDKLKCHKGKNVTINLDIDSRCFEDKAYSDSLEDGDTCQECEFLIEDDVYCIGAQLFGTMGKKQRCEKGYWKEDV